MRSILITGCSRGLGLGLVRRLAEREPGPRRIIAACRRPDQATDLHKLAQKHNNIHVLPLDVCNFESYDTVVKQVSDILKEDGLNVLVNNAGIPGKYARISYFKADDMKEAFMVNTVAPIMLTKAFIPLLKQSSKVNKNLPLGSSRAAVINMSSILGSIEKNAEGGYYIYRCSKSALNAATKSFSVDLKSSCILVTCLHPGWVKTDMGGRNAPMTVEEACGAITEFLYCLNEKHNGGFYSYDGSSLPW